MELFAGGACLDGRLGSLLTVRRSIFLGKALSTSAFWMDAFARSKDSCVATPLRSFLATRVSRGLDDPASGLTGWITSLLSDIYQ